MRTNLSAALLLCLLGTSQCALAGDYLLRLPQQGLKAPAPVEPAPPPVVAPPSAQVGLDYAVHTGTEATLSADGLTWFGYSAYIRGTAGSTKNFYFEVTPASGAYVDVGLTDGGAGVGFIEMDIRGDVYIGGRWAVRYGALPSHVGIAWEATTGTAHIYYEGVHMGSHYFGARGGPVYPVLYSNGGVITASFNASNFGGRMPAGYSALR